MLTLVLTTLADWIYLTPSAYNRGRLRRMMIAIHFRLSRLERILRSLHSRISCRTWLAIEKRTIETDDEYSLVRRAIRWTARTSPFKKLDDLAPCLLESLDPREALLQWLAHASKTPYNVLPLALVENNFDFDRIMRSDTHNIDMVTCLVLHACQRAVDKPGDMASSYDTTMVHVVLWLSRRHRGKLDDHCWLYLSHVVNVLDPIRSTSIVIAVTDHLLHQCQRLPARLTAQDPVIGESGIATYYAPLQKK